jgi:hypothetical protein
VETGLYCVSMIAQSSNPFGVIPTPMEPRPLGNLFSEDYPKEDCQDILRPEYTQAREHRRCCLGSHQIPE